mgnify:CR=1 FL=1
MDRVLVVDDNRDLGELTSEILEERGFKVNIAYDGESALARIKQEPYDLMILDYKLPRMSGLTVLERTLRIRPNLKTIMISAFGDDSTRTRAKELGAYAFLDKPFNIDRLKKIVKKALTEQKRRCVNEANGHSKHSRFSSDEHLGFTGFGSASNSPTNGSKDRYPIHIGAS